MGLRWEYVGGARGYDNWLPDGSYKYILPSCSVPPSFLKLFWLCRGSEAAGSPVLGSTHSPDCATVVSREIGVEQSLRAAVRHMVSVSLQCDCDLF